MKKTILLINLGSPASCRPHAIKRFLKEFLSDPRVIDLPFWIRWPLVNLFIVPFRYQWTTEAYKKIWTDDGPPLLTISKAQSLLLSNYLGDDFQVDMAMRYGGGPTLHHILKKTKESEEVIIVPLFPQYSSATTGSVIQKVMDFFAKQTTVPKLRIIQEFYQHPSFIKAYSALLGEHLSGTNIDKLIFSYHGLPERHIIKTCEAACDRKNICPNIHHKNHACYRAQCMATSKYLAKSLHLTSEQYLVSFQSRLGKIPWTGPYTDLLLPELIKKGVRNIAICSPSFVSDCLETLEEIDLRLRSQWLKLGGKEFIFIPSLNTHPLWIKALADIAGANSE